MRKAHRGLVTALGVGMVVGGMSLWAEWEARQAVATLEGLLRGLAREAPGKLHVDPLRGEAALSDIRLRGDASSLTIRKAATEIRPPGQGGMRRVRLEGISGRHGSVSIEAERAEIAQAGARPAAGRLIPAALAAPAPRLGLGSSIEPVAASILTIPESTFRTETRNERATIVFRNIRLDMPESGPVASLSMEGATLRAEKHTGEPEAEVTFGPISVAKVNLDTLRRLWSPEPGQTDFVDVLQSVSIGPIRLKSHDDGEFQIAGISLGHVAARPEATLVEAMAELLDAMAAGSPPDVAVTLGQVLDRVRIDGLELNDLAIKAKEEQVDARLGRFALFQMAARTIGSLEITGLEARTPDGFFANHALVLKGIDFSIKGQDADTDDQPLAPPTIEAMRMEGFDFAAQGHSGSLALAEMSARYGSGPVPTAFRSTMRNLVVPIPSDQTDEGTKSLREMGIDRIDMSVDAEGLWNPNTRDYSLGGFTIRLTDMGAVSLSANLGDVSPEVFLTDPVLATQAVLGATLKDITLRVENAGLFEKFIAKVAREQRMPEDRLRTSLGFQVAGLLTLLVKDQKLAVDAARAVNQFTNDPRAVVISARPSSPVRFDDIMVGATADPGQLLESLGLQVRANP